ncbi:MAG TPA: hypothetical protein VKR24_08900, partial [Candidatus Limnocylindrales bacterium]|nr:hypothetical protein [Candidatus Limnocylindrales bacterium]
MIRLEELSIPDGLSDAVDSARRGLTTIDRDSIGDAATSAARTVLPERWFRPKPRRWPFVVAALLLLAMVASVFLVRLPQLSSAPADEPDPSNPEDGQP